jgi:hypothetical protein
MKRFREEGEKGENFVRREEIKKRKKKIDSGGNISSPQSQPESATLHILTAQSHLRVHKEQRRMRERE